MFSLLFLSEKFSLIKFLHFFGSEHWYVINLEYIIFNRISTMIKEFLWCNECKVIKLDYNTKLIDYSNISIGMNSVRMRNPWKSIFKYFHIQFPILIVTFKLKLSIDVNKSFVI